MVEVPKVVEVQKVVPKTVETLKVVEVPNVVPHPPCVAWLLGYFLNAPTPRWNELDLFGRPLGKFTEPANFDENRARMGFGSEAET